MAKETKNIRIVKRNGKAYQYYVETFYHKGKQYEATGKSQKEAIIKADRKRQALENGEIGINPKMTVKRWGEEWLETYKKDNVTDKVYKMHLSKFKNIICPEIGSLRLIEVNDIHLQKILNSRSGYSKSDTNKLKQLMQGMFKQARTSRLIVFDPSESLVMPKVTEGTTRSLTKAERKMILDFCPHHKAGTWIKVMLLCGLRPGETYALQWRHIDFKKRRIKVAQAKESGSNKIKDTKTKSGNRSIPIFDDSLYNELKVIKGEPFDPVFTQQTNDRPHTETSGKCLWNNFKRELDISRGATLHRNQIQISTLAPDLKLYCLRHTFGTDCQDAGIPINVIKYLMGHADIKTTANIYIDTTEDSIKQAEEKMKKQNNGNNNGKKILRIKKYDNKAV